MGSKPNNYKKIMILEQRETETMELNPDQFFVLLCLLLFTNPSPQIFGEAASCTRRGRVRFPGSISARALEQRLPPLLIVDVPLNGFVQSFREVAARFPFQFRLYER